MKIFKTIITVFTLLVLGTHAQAQGKNTESVKIKTSAVCDMCKTTIEKGLAYEKGILSSSLDVPTQMLTVQYRSDKTSLETIRKALNEIGYDADSLAANPRAYSKLDACCKKDKGVH